MSTGSAFMLIGVISVVLTVAGCSNSLTKKAMGEVKVNQGAEGAIPTTSPQIVYVQGFELEYEQIHSGGIKKRGMVSNLLPRRLKGETPEHKATRIVDTMADSIVAGLADKGITARKYAAGPPLPTDGWLVRGAFNEVDEGSRVVRAIIGFGAGATSMVLSVTVSDLAKHADAPFLVFGTEKEAGKMPGAVVTMNPYMAAAKFMLEKNATDKDIKKTAEQIVDQLEQVYKKGLPAKN